MKKILCLTLLLTGCAFAAMVQAKEPPSPPAVPETFIKQLADGINARDLNAIRKIVYPGTLTCMTPEKDDYYAWKLWQDGTKPYRISTGYKVRTAAPINVGKLGIAPKDMSLKPVYWPAQPDTGLYFSYHSARMSIMQRFFQIKVDKDRASLVMDCPTALGLEYFHKIKIAEEQRAKKLERLWESLSPEDKQAFSLMAKEGLKFDGMKAAEEKYHLDGNESLAFMDMIEYADTP